MMRILLVAGHGAGDAGACAEGLREADLTRELAEKIQRGLDGSAELFDISKNLYKYLKSGKSFDFSKYDYVLEIHFNAGSAMAKDGRTTGCEMLIHSGKPPHEGDRLILEKLSRLGFKNRGIKYRNDLLNMNVLKKKGINYALLEVCFIDDPDDMKIFNRQKDEVARAVAEGLKDAFGLTAEVECVNDIVCGLAERGVITDKGLWLKKLAEDKNAYWLARKALRELRNG